jgi:hypothetical protein
VVVCESRSVESAERGIGDDTTHDIPRLYDLMDKVQTIDGSSIKSKESA